MRRQKTRLLAPGNMEEVILIAFYLVSLPGWRYLSSFMFTAIRNGKIGLARFLGVGILA